MLEENIEVTDRIELWKFSSRVDLPLIVLEAIAQHFDIASADESKQEILTVFKKAKDSLLALISAFKFSVKHPDGTEYKVNLDATECGKRVGEILKAADKKGKESFSVEFDKLIEHGLKEKTKLVVLLDDLDRCLPDEAFELLQTLRIFFDSKRVIFLIAMDESVIKCAIQSRFGKDSGVNGQWYLEKLLDRKYRIPFPTPAQLNSFFYKKYEELTGEKPPSELQGPMTNWGFDKIEIYGSKAANNPRRIVRALERMIELATLTDDVNRSAIFASWPFFVIREIYPDFYELIKKDGGIAISWGNNLETRGIIADRYGNLLTPYLHDQDLIGLCTVVRQCFGSRNNARVIVESLLRYIDGELDQKLLIVR
ncbi:MAG: P-loop NTPase fold protein [candidate division WOR-3 bacterium]|nr:P-loop NTPase fold protein [candidate division WOR-3 bacterium]